ncbi:MAG: hypothetical protein K2Q22_14190 [Cytophagales bacterium]|nr:hypothetical protein [Cytophagales bacterium]
MKPYISKVLFVFIAIFVWYCYNGTLIPRYGIFRDKPNNAHYFKDLALSFLNGKFEIECPEGTSCHDLVQYEGKNYLYWPPAPAIAYIPIVYFYGRESPDELISSILGALNVFLVMLIVAKFSRNNQIPINNFVVGLTGIFWGLGTVHFYMSMVSSVWFFSQVIAQTFLLTSILIFISRFSNLYLFLSGLFWAFACYSRNGLVFSVFFFLAIFWVNFNYKFSINNFFTKGLIFFLPFLIFTIFNLYYNKIRFGDFFENGIQYHNMSSYFFDNYQKYGYFSKHYLLYNFFIEIISTPPFIKEFPYFGNNDEGFGLLWVSPIFWMLFPVAYNFVSTLELKEKSNFLKSDKVILVGLILTIVFIAGIIFSIMGTGWVQFGARYTLDFQIFLVLFILYIFKILSQSIFLYLILFTLLLLSLFINYVGVVYFFKLYLF